MLFLLHTLLLVCLSCFFPFDYVETATVTIDLSVVAYYFNSSCTPISFWTRSYNSLFPGPVVRVRQGDTVIINVDNQLGPETETETETDPSRSFSLRSSFPFSASSLPLGFHHPNITNIHLHGLHLSPLTPSDDIFTTRIAPLSSYSYRYDIPIDHSIGTYFYHPHSHGSASLQQGGGMAGAFIVDPADDQIIPKELKQMKETILLLQHLCFDGCAMNGGGGGEGDPNPYMNHLTVSKYSGDGMMPRPQYRYPSAAIQSYYLINGEYLPTITTSAPYEFLYLRFIHASITAFLQLSIQPYGYCDMFALARDGIFFDTPSSPSSSFLLLPGSRLDIAFRCNKTGNYSLISKRASPFDEELEENTFVYNGVLGTFMIEGKEKEMSLPSSLPPRPSYLTDLQNQSPSHYFTVNLYSQGGNIIPGPPYPYYTINGQSFNGLSSIMINITLGLIEEWHLKIDKDESMGTNHPFHMHVNPVQIIQGGGVLDINNGEWRDTIPLTKSRTMIVRFRPDSFIGPALFHCHMIPHQEFGMAAVAYINQQKQD